MATIGTDETGQAYNINADVVAGAIAEALGAEKLIYLTDIEGLRRDVDDPTSLIRRTTADELDELIADGTIAGGMIPKVASCVQAVRNGVGGAHILDGRIAHVLLLEIFTDEGIGTMVSAGRHHMSERVRRAIGTARPRCTSAILRRQGAPVSAPVDSRRARSCPCSGRRRSCSSRVTAPSCGTPTASGTSTSSAASPSISLGHANPVVAEAIAKQAGELLHVSNLFANPVATRAAMEVDRCCSR